MDESQDAMHYVLAGVLAPDLLTLQAIVGDIRTTARRLGFDRLTEFREKELYRDYPRLLNKALELLVTGRRRKGRRPHPRDEIGLFVAYYAKGQHASCGSGLPGPRLKAVYRAAFRAILENVPSSEAPVVVVCDHFQYGQVLLPELIAIHAERFSGTVSFADSMGCKPLQLADLVAGTARRYLAEESNGWLRLAGASRLWTEVHA